MKSAMCEARSAKIELFRHEDGELGIYCEMCDKVNTINQKWCCQWAEAMYWYHCWERVKELEAA